MMKICSYLYNSILENGGLTYNVYRNQKTISGYATAMNCTNERIISFDKFNEREIFNYIKDNSNALKHDKINFGAWIDNDKVYFDLSVVNDNFEETKLMAEKYNQLAFFDLNSNETHYLN